MREVTPAVCENSRNVSGGESGQIFPLWEMNLALSFWQRLSRDGIVTELRQLAGKEGDFKWENATILSRSMLTI
jgi:hypothetical protein